MKINHTFSFGNGSQAVVKMVDGFKEDSNVDDIFEIENTLHGYLTLLADYKFYGLGLLNIL
ncbi:MAG: hypothetical protein CM1200mP10_23630 [Candidatus Neomarinimicrobiota bacterium]|nr:MAG: hypothetical protein CM1200mP10_23630 [Candidatus Neomarinimicrobiota bacterium]